MTGDLAGLAERRSGLAALLGMLLLEEPGPHLAELVSAVPALVSLASGDPALASEYQRVFLRGVPLYESVFRSDDGQQGGPTVATLTIAHARIGFGEAAEGRWRVGGADHLGLQLRCHAQLCRTEAEAWRDGVTDAAVAAVEAERTFLADHVAPWATVALGAAHDLAEGGPYGPLLQATMQFLDEEYERLRPAPLLYSTDPDPEVRPRHLGPARLTRLLLAPAACGGWIAHSTIAAAAAAIGAPWRPVDTRSSLRQLIESAADTNELDLLLEPISAGLLASAARQDALAVSVPGNAFTARRWSVTAVTTADLLSDVAERGFGRDGPAAASETITVAGPDAAGLGDAIDQVVRELRGKGFIVERHDHLASR